MTAKEFFGEKYVALHYPDFRLLWLGQLISSSGTQMQVVAANWHIYVLTHSPIALGLLGIFRFLPMIIFSLIGGNYADAHNRKLLLAITQSVMAVFAFILTIATFTHVGSPWIIYTVSFVTSIAYSFDMPARQAFIPSLVDKKHLANAISLNTIMFHVSAIVGPALSGFIIAKFGVGSVYLFNALSFIAVLGALWLMKSNGDIQGEPSETSWKAIVEGLTFVKSKTIIWSTMLLDFFSTFFASATALVPIFAADILHVGAQGLGFLYAAQSVGAVFAGFFVAHLGHIKKQGKILLWSVVFYAIGTIVFGFSTNFWLSFFALLVAGAGDNVSSIIRNNIRQLTTPDSLRGRMTGVNMIFFLGGPHLGEFEAGILAAIIGTPLSVVTGGVGTLIVVLTMAAAIPLLGQYEVKMT